jgi:hypothetical protein
MSSPTGLWHFTSSSVYYVFIMEKASSLWAMGEKEAECVALLKPLPDYKAVLVSLLADLLVPEP